MVEHVLSLCICIQMLDVAVAETNKQEMAMLDRGCRTCPGYPHPGLNGVLT